MGLHDAALRAGVFQHLQKRAGELFAAAKADLAALPNGDTVAGRHHGDVLCKASWVKGRQSIVVDDPQALLEWVKTHHPTEVVGLLSTDPGSWCRGCGSKQGDPYITVKSTPDAPFLVAQLIAGGQVSLDGTRELEA